MKLLATPNIFSVFDLVCQFRVSFLILNIAIKSTHFVKRIFSFNHEAVEMEIYEPFPPGGSHKEIQVVVTRGLFL